MHGKEEISGSRMEDEAPGTFGSLAKLLSSEDLLKLEEAYAEARNLGFFEEHPVVRSEGASFNPRPARLCHILMKHGAGKNAELFYAAVFASGPRNSAGLDMNSFPSAKLLAQQSLNFPSEVPPEKKKDIELIALARALDTVRHLHMSSSSLDERQRILSGIYQILSAAEHPDSAKLRLVLKDSIEKYSRFHS